jgi:hypothetical protein
MNGVLVSLISTLLVSFDRALRSRLRFSLFVTNGTFNQRRQLRASDLTLANW